MTVTYSSQVTSSTGFSPFLKLLVRWKGSIYKIVWFDLILFLLFYYTLRLSYLYAMDELTQRHFNRLVKYCDTYSSLIPLSFVLGFYVSLVMTRWWSQYSTIPFPDNLAILIGAIIKGEDDRARIVRRTIVRYVCATFTITLTMMSPKVKKRFPTLKHFIDAGLLTEEEQKIMEDLDNEFPSYSKYWLPLAWATNIVTRARHEGLIRDDEAVKGIVDELNAFRTKCGGMLDYDWISIPLVYTQVVTLAVYSYFIIKMIANQNTNPSEMYEWYYYFPLLPVLEFFFYMGWLKVAETLINPYGEDDDDFEVMWMIDRHLQVCYLLVDKIHHEHPKLMKDLYWLQSAPTCLPYTIASQNYVGHFPIESTKKLKIKKEQQDSFIPTEEVDGNFHEKSWWNNLTSMFFKKHSTTGIRLNEINSSKTKGHSYTETTEELNVYADIDPNKIEIDRSVPGKSSEYFEDYERLKQQRIKAHKEKLLKYIELMNEGKSTDERKKIIDEMYGK